MLQKWAEPTDGRQENLLEQLTHASWRQIDGPSSILGTNTPNNHASVHPLQGKAKLYTTFNLYVTYCNSRMHTKWL